MKTMDSLSGPGANHSHSYRYGEDLQRRPGCEDAFSCSDTFGVLYQASDQFQRHRCGLTAADTQRGQALGQATRLQCMDQRHHNARAAGANGVA